MQDSLAVGRIRPARVPVVAAFALFLALGVISASLGAALPFLRTEYDLTAGSGGVVSAYNLGALVAIVGCGAAERILRPRPAMAVLLLIFAGGCAGAGFAASWTLFVVFATLAGFGYGGLVLYLNTAFANGFGRRNVLMLNLLNAAFGIGAVLGPILVGVASRVDVRVLLIGVAILALPCLPAIGCAVLLPRTPDSAVGPPRPRRSRAEVSAMVAVILPFALIGFLYAGLETSVGAWESTHLTWLGVSGSTAAQLTSLFWAGLAIGRIVIPLVATRIKPPAIVGTGLAVATLALGLAANPDFSYYGYALAGFAIAPVLPTTLAWMAAFTPSPQFANSVVLTACMAANVVHPVLVGLVADPAQPERIPFLLATFALVGLLALLWGARRVSIRARSADHFGGLARTPRMQN